MNLLDKASIVLTASAYDNGKVLCVKPSDGSGDMDFSRNSAATRVNSQGLVEDVQILSSNLVQNGSFSEQGAEEVSNGSFSQQGSQQITNGDFATDSNWTKGTGWSISGGSADCDGTQTSNTELKQQGGILGSTINFVVGKTYKVNFDIVVTSGLITNIEVASGNDGYNVTTSGNHTTYITAVSTNNRLTIAATPDFVGSIDNVSVVEVGQDWTLGTGWSIGEDKAVCDGTQTSQTNLFQVGIVPINVNYKVTFTTTVSAGGVILAIGGSNAQPIVTSSGTYTFTDKATSGDANLYLSGNADFIGSIDNVSVVEVGQDWDLGTGWSIADNKAVCDGTNIAYLTQTGVLATGTSYRVQFDIVDYTSGSVKYRDNGLVSGQSFSGVGSYTDYVVAGGGQFRLMSENFIGSVTNISVKEVGQNWNTSAGITIQDEVCKFISTGSGGALTSTTAQLISGKQYLVKFEITYQDGTSKVKINNSGSSGVFKGNVNLYEQVFTCTSTAYLQFYFTNAGSCFIDNISVIEITNDTNLPRINYEGFSFDGSGDIIPDSGCGSWLFEPQSTNLITYSENFNQWGNLGNRSAVTLNSIISPDGTINGTKQTQIVANNSVRLRFSAILTIGTEYTFSVFAKKGNYDKLVMNISGVSTNFTLTDNWVRYEITATAPNNTFVDVGISQGSIGDFIYLWGAQAEEQSFATSYIPTSGTQKTRNQDLCTNGGSVATISSTSGVLYVEAAKLNENSPNFKPIGLTNGSQDERLVIIFGQGQEKIRFQVKNNGLVVFQNDFNVTSLSQQNKIAIRYSNTTGYAFFINGVKVGVNPSLIVPPITRLDFGVLSNFNGKTKCLAVFPLLTDTELQELTTI